MSWIKSAKKDRTEELEERDIRKLSELTEKLRKLKNQLFASQSSSYYLLKELLDDKYVRSHDDIWKVLSMALTGENNQKLVLDSPHTVRYTLQSLINKLDARVYKAKIELKRRKQDKMDKND